MPLRLSSDDRCALDVLLDYDENHSANGQSTGVWARCFSNESKTLYTRLTGAERWLKLISLMPAPEPCANLVSKTLKRIDAQASRSSQAIARIITALPRGRIAHARYTKASQSQAFLTAAGAGLL